MTDLTTLEAALRQLRAPIRNQYPPSKLLDTRHLEMEQFYFMHGLATANRLGVGWGVWAGLEIVLIDGTQARLRAGIAIDGIGREIVVPRDVVIAVSQPTDDRGLPSGPPLKHGSVTVYLAYAECDADPTPVILDDCDTRQGCAPGATQERFRVIVRQDDANPATGLDDAVCAAIFPAQPPAKFDSRTAAVEQLRVAVGTPQDPFVMLASISLGGQPSLDQLRYRTQLVSNQTLLDLILCLAARVDACCADTGEKVLELEYVSGDGQKGKADQALADPLVVRVLEQGAPVAGVPVTFDAGASGTLDDALAQGTSLVVISAGDGSASVNWTLAANAPYAVEARLQNGSSHIFSAGLLDAPAESLAVVRAIRPEPAAQLSMAQPAGTEWRDEPQLRIAFSQPMDPNALADNERWLGLWLIGRADQGGPTVRVRWISLKQVADPLGHEGLSATYQPAEPLGDFFMGTFLVQIRADADGPIFDAEVPQRLLDADYRATGLHPDLLDKVWEIGPGNPVGDLDRAISDDLRVAAPPLPSGNGTAGGRFHSWFEVTQ